MEILENNNPLSAILGALKLICTKELKISDEIYRYGDLIYDTKNSEYGIYLGNKPVDIRDSPEILDRQMTNIVKTPNKVTTILLTLSKIPETDAYTFRIRYTLSSYLQKVTPGTKVNSRTDLEIFCSEICFMDCSHECPLWKYGCWKKT